MGLVRDTMVVGAATFIVGSVLMEVSVKEKSGEPVGWWPYVGTFVAGALGYYLVRAANVVKASESFTAECDDLCIKCEWCDTCINDICENAEEEWGREWADFGHLCRICHDKHKEELGMGAESFSAEGVDGSRAKSDDYWLYHGHNRDGSWCGQKLWVSKGLGYAYLCSCNATLTSENVVLSAKNPKKLPESKDPKTTPYGTIFIDEFMSEAESFEAHGDQYQEPCFVFFGKDDELPIEISGKWDYPIPNKGWVQTWVAIQIENNRTWPSKQAAKEAFMRWLKKEKCNYNHIGGKWDDVNKFHAGYEKYNIPLEETPQVQIIEDEVDMSAESFSAEKVVSWICDECGNDYHTEDEAEECRCKTADWTYKQDLLDGNPAPAGRTGWSDIVCSNCGDFESVETEIIPEKCPSCNYWMNAEVFEAISDDYRISAKRMNPLSRHYIPPSVNESFSADAETVEGDGWFSVSYTSTEEQANAEKKRFDEDGMKRKGNYRYKVMENPDKQGWTVLATRDAESFAAEGKSYVCRRNKKHYKRTKIHPDWAEFGYPNAVCWNCMELECVKGVSRFDDPKEWGDDEKGPIRIRWEDADAESFAAEGKCSMYCKGKNDVKKGSLACEPCAKKWGERMKKDKDFQRNYNPPEDYYRAESFNSEVFEAKARRRTRFAWAIGKDPISPPNDRYHDIYTHEEEMKYHIKGLPDGYFIHLSRGDGYGKNYWETNFKSPHSTSWTHDYHNRKGDATEAAIKWYNIQVAKPEQVLTPMQKMMISKGVSKRKFSINMTDTTTPIHSIVDGKKVLIREVHTIRFYVMGGLTNMKPFEFATIGGGEFGIEFPLNEEAFDFVLPFIQGMIYLPQRDMRGIRSVNRYNKNPQTWIDSHPAWFRNMAKHKLSIYISKGSGIGGWTTFYLNGKNFLRFGSDKTGSEATYQDGKKAIYGTGTQEYYAEGDWKELRPTTQKKLLAKAIAMGGDQKDLNGNMLVGRLFLLYVDKLNPFQPDTGYVEIYTPSTADPNEEGFVGEPSKYGKFVTQGAQRMARRYRPKV